MSGAALAIVGAVLAAGGGAAAGWWFGYGQGFTKAILGSEKVPVAEEARTIGFGSLAVNDETEGVA